MEKNPTDIKYKEVKYFIMNQAKRHRETKDIEKPEFKPKQKSWKRGRKWYFNSK